MSIPHDSVIAIRVPDDDQLLAAVRLGEAMWDESPVYRLVSRDTDKMIEFAYIARADDRTFFQVAVNGDQHVCGFLVGSIAPYGFHDSVFAFDRLVYVEPDMRGTGVVNALIRAFEAWAWDHGAARIVLGTTTGVNTYATEHLYNKLGYETVGKLMMKELH